MGHLLPLLTDHVRRAVEKCGALGASVYVPTPWNTAAPGILVQVGNGVPLPEMADLERAQAFASGAATKLAPADDPARLTTAVVPSATPEGCFLPIPLLSTLWHRASMTSAVADDSKGPSRRLADRLGGPPIVGWLGLRFAEPPAHLQYSGGWQSLLELASALASTYVCFYGILTDPVTGLPGRAELNGTLRAELERVRANRLPFSLVFVKLENLDHVSDRFGRRMADAVLREFLEVLQGAVRRSDTVMRYGESIFALPLRDVVSSGAVIVGEKIRRRVAERLFLDGNVQLPCAVGVASCDGTEDPPLQPLDLLSRTDQALSASQREGCAQVVLWRADGAMATAEHLDPLIGVFTGQTEKDYRNMRLLWDVLQAVSSSTGSELAQAVVARILSLFAATRAALFERNADGTLRVTAGLQRLGESGAVSPLGVKDIGPAELGVNQDALTSLEPQHRAIESMGAADATGQTAFVVPLVIDGRALGTLYVLGGTETLRVDATDFPVLGGVAAQLALALDREQLAAEQRGREHRERQVLRAELDRLRTVLKQSQFIFRSKAMADLLESTRRVATTDATVLITGESGTGKEMLAHTLHELGARRAKPLVIVDCGAIPASLMDSELFGRERGAFTGAERRAGGRLVQADGGTVFLDEIGELPLEVQAKLLRFVQEKTITMVGDTRSQKVDVRIIAATNRSLEEEVAAGRFREDLFHRLNVVRLRVPPLRERPDDVLFLARHFLEAFAGQYAKGVSRLDPGAEARLQAYDWPGNVRELQNTVLQSVVLSQSDVIKSDDLQLPEGGRVTPVPASTRNELQKSPVAAMAQPRRTPVVTGDDVPMRFAEARLTVADRLAAEIAAVVSAGTKVGPPLGKWIAHDLVLEANEHAGGIAARAATSLGLPETTYSRRFRQAEAEASTTKRPESWDAVRGAVRDLVRSTDRPAGNVLDDLDQLLLRLVLEHAPGQFNMAASLMGVSTPTLKRRLAESGPAGSAPAEGGLICV